VIIGDLIENALPNSPGGAIFDQALSPDEQVADMRKILEPIAHKCLVAVPGNHEERTMKVAGIDPLKLGICQPLRIPYFDEPVHMDIFWRGHLFTFFIRHGRGGAQTKGGKLNNASRPLSVNEHTMFTVMGHVHDPSSDKNTKRCIEYMRDEDGRVIDIRIKKRVEYVVICPATYRYFNTYAARAGYSPGAQHMSVACVLEANGRYHLDKKPLKVTP